MYVGPLQTVSIVSEDVVEAATDVGHELKNELCREYVRMHFDTTYFSFYRNKNYNNNQARKW